ncbi:Imm53 family immunity protein [Bremerella sp. T1]|uniref:Imm53 family immunity protein n=1 Tax=Bremerella sp. TYQ1 TaxID=3119568 RepID=UPI001CCFC65D|nr:Imm53 family immunity protein [Bremerella volcania]UBM37921.1 immunity 53 family protein [Bremerella volcania]
MSLDRAAEEIERWYADRCDGQWEHKLGVRIETTDNPGWLATFDVLPLDSSKLADVLGSLLREHQAQVSTDGKLVRIFAPHLQQCLLAVEVVLKCQA